MMELPLQRKCSSIFNIIVFVKSLSHVQLFTTSLTVDARLLCPPLSPRVCSDSCPLSQWCYLTISASATYFSFCLQSFPASGSFPTSQLFASDGQSIGASASKSVLPMNIQGWCPLWLTGLISLLSKGLSRVLSITIWKHQFLSIQPSLWSNSHIHIYWKNHTGKAMVFPVWKNHSFDYMDLCRQSDASAFEYTI